MTPLQLSEYKRIMWKKRIRDFWLDYAHNRIGIVGITILVLFIFVAIFAPYIAPCSSEAVGVAAPRQADKYAYPEWIGIFLPYLSDLPPQVVYTSNWTVQESSSSLTWQKSPGGTIMLHYNASRGGSNESVTFSASSPLNYPYKPPDFFGLDFHWNAKPDIVFVERKWNMVLHEWTIIHLGASMEYMLKLYLITPDGSSYLLWDQNWYRYNTATFQPEPAFWSENTSGLVSMSSDIGSLAIRLGYDMHEPTKMVHDIFSSKGLYRLQMSVAFKPGEINGEQVALENATGAITFSPVDFTIWGRRWGVLGTDGLGHDVFSQLIYGSRISLIVGLSAAIIATSIGILVGITSGYLGGTVDEALMRTVDILLCLPVLPILLVLIAILGYSTWYIILIIAIFGWQGLARLLRSSVLSIRETAFIESAVASGGSKAYVIMKHVLPNILPIALVSLVLAIPGAIILEAALSFLGMGDPTSPTWGKMLYFSRITGGFRPIHMAWWAVFPPGFAITFLCISFVFMGHAVDEIVNPRLRRRR